MTIFVFVLGLLWDERVWRDTAEAQHREMAALAPNAHFDLVEGAGHFLPIERPDETRAVNLDWLGNLMCY